MLWYTEKMKWFITAKLSVIMAYDIIGYSLSRHGNYTSSLGCYIFHLTVKIFYYYLDLQTAFKKNKATTTRTSLEYHRKKQAFQIFMLYIILQLGCVKTGLYENLNFNLHQPCNFQIICSVCVKYLSLIGNFHLKQSVKVMQCCCFQIQGIP